MDIYNRNIYMMIFSKCYDVASFLLRHEFESESSIVDCYNVVHEPIDMNER